METLPKYPACRCWIQSHTINSTWTSNLPACSAKVRLASSYSCVNQSLQLNLSVSHSFLLWLFLSNLWVLFSGETWLIEQVTPSLMIWLRFQSSSTSSCPTSTCHFSLGAFTVISNTACPDWNSSNCFLFPEHDCI